MQVITEGEEKTAALAALVEQLIRGRNAEARQPNKPELTSTTIVSIPLTEASAKIRTGMPLSIVAALCSALQLLSDKSARFAKVSAGPLHMAQFMT